VSGNFTVSLVIAHSVSGNCTVSLVIAHSVSGNFSVSLVIAHSVSGNFTLSVVIAHMNLKFGEKLIFSAGWNSALTDCANFDRTQNLLINLIGAIQPTLNKC